MSIGTVRPKYGMIIILVIVVLFAVSGCISKVKDGADLEIESGIADIVTTIDWEYDRVYDWEITKTASPDSVVIEQGESKVVEYTLAGGRKNTYRRNGHPCYFWGSHD